MKRKGTWKKAGGNGKPRASRDCSTWHSRQIWHFLEACYTEHRAAKLSHPHSPGQGESCWMTSQPPAEMLLGLLRAWPLKITTDCFCSPLSSNFVDTWGRCCCTAGRTLNPGVITWTDSPAPQTHTAVTRTRNTFFKPHSWHMKAFLCKSFHTFLLQYTVKTEGWIEFCVCAGQPLSYGYTIENHFIWKRL